MATEWFYMANNQKRGPVPSVEIKRLVRIGALKPETLLWKTGLADWIPAKSIKGLFPIAEPEVASFPSFTLNKDERQHVLEYASKIRITDGVHPTPKLRERWSVFASVFIGLMTIPGVLFWFAFSQQRPTVADVKSVEHPDENHQINIPAINDPVERDPLIADLEKEPDKRNDAEAHDNEIEQEKNKEVVVPPNPPIIANPQPPVRRVANLSDKLKVEKWLRDNLNSGTWKEIQWWPGMDITFGNRVRRICGMKFRTTNQFGAKVVVEMVFDTGAESARELKTGSWEYDQSVYDPDGLNWTAWEYLTGSNPKPDPLDHNGVNMFKQFFEGNRAAQEAGQFPDLKNKKKKK